MLMIVLSSVKTRRWCATTVEKLDILVPSVPSQRRRSQMGRFWL